MRQNLSVRDVRAIADFRILYATLDSLYSGINRGRATYNERVIVELAQVDVVRDALKKTERIQAWLAQLQNQVLEAQEAQPDHVVRMKSALG